MYFPYLRGKMFEILAVRDAEFLPSSRIVPIFEPVQVYTQNGRIYGRFTELIQKRVKFAFIVNSANGNPPPNFDQGVRMVRDLSSFRTSAPDLVLPAFEIRAENPIRQIRTFARKFESRQCVIVHRNHDYSIRHLWQALESLHENPPVHVLLDGGASSEVVKSLPASGVVLLRDGFSVESANVHYPPRSRFDDLLWTHEDRGYDGFSDFSIVGDRLIVSGGPPNHVALHLTELALDEVRSIATNHFVSRNPTYPGDAPRKYLDALELLIQHVGVPPNIEFDTEGVEGYWDSYTNSHFPGLGKPKQWSIMHHMEIINRELENLGIPTFL